MWLRTRLFFIQRYLFYLLILFLPTQFGKHFWPEFSYVQGIRSDYLSPTIYFTDVLILFLLISQLLLWIKILAAKYQISNYHVSRFFFHFPFFIFHFLKLKSKTLSKWHFVIATAFLAIGIFFSPSPLAGLYGFIKLLEMVFFGFFVSRFFSNSRNLKQELSTLSSLFYLSILFESSLALVQFFKQGSLGGMLYFFGERTFTGSTPGIANVSIGGELILRPYGTFPHPNVLAGFLLVGMTFLLFLYRDFRQSANSLRKNILFELARLAMKRVENYFNKTSQFAFQTHSKNNVITQAIVLFALSFGTIALMITFSRIPILLWIGVVAFYLFSSRISSLSDPGEHWESRRVSKVSLLQAQTKTWPIFVVLGICIIFLFSFSAVPQRFLETRFDEESFVTRVDLMSASLKMIYDYPLFGVGLNNFLIRIPEYLEKKTSGVFQPVHNMYLLLAAQCGIIIFIIILFFIKKTMLLLFRKIQKTKNPLDTAIFMSLIMLLTIGFFDHYLLTLQQGQLLLSFFLGVAFIKVKNKKA